MFCEGSRTGLSVTLEESDLKEAVPILVHTFALFQDDDSSDPGFGFENKEGLQKRCSTRSDRVKLEQTYLCEHVEIVCIAITAKMPHMKSLNSDCSVRDNLKHVTKSSSKL